MIISRMNFSLVFFVRVWEEESSISASTCQVSISLILTVFVYLQGDYIKHPVLYELSHKYGLPTENISDSQLSGKLEELKEIIRREIRKELKIKEGAEKLRGVSTDRRSLNHVATIVKNSNWKLAELKNELSELESQIILSQGHTTPSTPASNGGKDF